LQFHDTDMTDHDTGYPHKKFKKPIKFSENYYDLAALNQTARKSSRAVCKD